jgi:tetratricopeptide (TPR) repeat protein
MMSIDPADPEAYIRVSSIYIAVGANREARKVLTEAVERGIDNAEIYSNTAYLDMNEGALDTAIKNYELALNKDPGNGLYKFYLGVAYDTKGDQKEAIRILEECVKASPDLSDAFNYLGYLYALSGNDLDRAEELIKKALELDPDNGAYVDSLGWVYFKKGKIDEALSSVKKASELLPGDAVILDHLGDIYSAKGDNTLALEKWEESLAADPKNAEVRSKIEKIKK